MSSLMCQWLSLLAVGCPYSSAPLKIPGPKLENMVDTVYMRSRLLCVSKMIMKRYFFFPKLE